MREESGKGRKISVQQISKYFTEAQFKSADFGMLSLVRFQTPEEGAHNCDIDGICIAVVCSGSVKAIVNGISCELRNNSILMLNEDSVVTSMKCSKACMGYLISFSHPFINKSALDVADSMKLRMMCNSNPCLTVEGGDIEHLHRLAGTLSDMISVSNQYPYADKMVMSLFTSVFYMFMSILNENPDVIQPQRRVMRSDSVMQQFVALLSEKCESERSVEYYANCLGISPKYLSLICKNTLGRNASSVIDEAVVRKAKELLMQQGLSIQDIAEKLNFVSQSFFGKYFKQRVGISPSRYRSQGM
ncbi:MAG: AraC family transcriptional regulator [Alistipes sp.]|nr:AraC family transcriptional regulator [Alistipes sp.]